jgi:hypothetical protein
VGETAEYLQAKYAGRAGLRLPDGFGAAAVRGARAARAEAAAETETETAWAGAGACDIEQVVVPLAETVRHAACGAAVLRCCGAAVLRCCGVQGAATAWPLWCHAAAVAV